MRDRARQWERGEEEEMPEPNTSAKKLGIGRRAAAVGDTNDCLSFPLSHGQVLWVLTALGFAAGVTPKTFNYYIKSLRKLGVPFEPVELRHRAGRLAKYSFSHVIELALALTLRVYGTLPDAVVAGLINHRSELKEFYREALATSTRDHERGLRVLVKGHPYLYMHGSYLELDLRYSGGRLLEMGTPRLVTPYEALRLFTTTGVSDRTHLPLNLSALVRHVCEKAQSAPVIRRGPAPAGCTRARSESATSG